MNIKPIKKTPDDLTAKLAEESGQAIVVVNENRVVSKANNNSICEHLYASEEFAPRCDKFCGRAFEMATETGAPVPYQCHAGLDCLAVPLKTEKPLVAIVGRTFTKSENFEEATKRAFAGDWRKFPQSEFFGNVLISGSSKGLETVAKRLENSGNWILEAEKESKEQSTTTGGQLTKLIEEFHQQSVVEPTAKRTNGDTEEIAAWRSLFGSLFDSSYREACLSIIKFLSQQYSLSSLAWLERHENRFESILATGTLEGREFKINLPVNDKLLFDALEKDLSLDLRERTRNGEKINLQTISLFPVAVGKEVQNALIVADNLKETALKRRIARFCKTVATRLEILRLREELKRRSGLTEAMEKFNASLKNLDREDFWANLTSLSAELMHAERSSLLIFDEKSNSLTVRAAIGASAERITNKSEHIGERVARLVLQSGKPVVVNDVSKIGLPAAPSDWKYKTNSFISYPFTIDSRRVGILNVTDKADGAPYDEADLEILNAIAPQVAVLIDRAALKSRAGEYEQLSVTDVLTGLVNRRYLEERLTEEIKRSNRYGYPMSFMMVDVDHFKSYNDQFGHAEGDKALKLVAQGFRETLRSADIAARYGGEEFSILLPQTSTSEAETIAERVREHIEATKFPNRRITISIGIANCCLELNSTRELIVAADTALYEAKRKGRNRVQIYENINDNDENGKK
jgi:diguanylate cyclase (GGDEF)-like protein